MSEKGREYWMALPPEGGAAVPAHPEEADFQFHRRDFLRAVGFVVGGAILTGCGRGVERKAIPYLIPAGEVVPGRTYHYATLCGGCTAGCGVLTRNRDGRPIKLEGNPGHPVSGGGLCAVGQAAVLGVYDSKRLKGPLSGGKPADWAAVDGRVRAGLEAARAAGQSVRVLTGTLSGPTLRAGIDAFLARFPGGRRVAYDALSASALLDAHAEMYGVRVLPRYHFDRADVIVSFDADFLGTWISPVEYTAAYRRGRTLAGEGGRFSRHIQFEAGLSVTGSKADQRVLVLPGDMALVMAHLAAQVAARAGAAVPWGALDPSPVPAAKLEELARRLWEARGRSLVVCGANDLSAQRQAIYLNHLLGNCGAGDGTKPVDLGAPARAREGNDRETAALLEELQAGKVGALFIHGVNPVYDLPEGEAWAAALKKVPLVVSTAEREDETAACATLVCPDHHWLESWGDAEAVAGCVTVSQPALRPLGDTRGVLESLSTWGGTPREALAAMQEIWREQVYPHRVPGPDGAQGAPSFQAFWDKAVHDGFTLLRRDPVRPGAFQGSALAAPPRRDGRAAEALVLALHPGVCMLDGRHAHNPWLQEIPDPITKLTWSNCVALAPETAGRLGLAEGDVVRVTLPREGGAGAAAVELPVLRQPGQHPGLVAIALGYGRRGTDRFANIGPGWIEARPTVAPGGLVGVNAAPFLGRREGTPSQLPS